MAINLNPANFSGLASLAGRGTGGLRISSPGALGLQALQVAQNRDAQQRRQQLELMRIQQQGQMGLLANQNARDQLQLAKYQGNQKDALARASLLQEDRQFQSGSKLAHQRLAQQDAQFQAQMALKERQQAMEESSKEMAKLLDKDNDYLKERGAFAVSAKLALEKAQSPEEAAQIKNLIIEEGLKRKYFSSQQAALGKKLPLSAFGQQLDYAILMNDAVKNYKDLQGNRSKGNPSGNLTPAMRTQMQKDLSNAQDNKRELLNMMSNVPERYFGAESIGQDVTWWREWGQKITGLGPLIEPSKEDKDDLQRFSRLKAGVEMFAMNTIKQLSGVQYSDKQLEYMKKFVPSIGKGATYSEYKGKVENLRRFFDSIEEDRQKALQIGPFGSREYQDEMRRLMDLKIMKDINSELKISDEEKAFLKSKGYSEEEINRIK